MSSLIKFQLSVRDLAGEKSLFDIPTGVTLIGRQPGAALLLNQLSISRQHARIDCDGQDCYLTDLNSANGTLLDGKKLQAMAPYRLAHGAEIAIGDFKLVFERVQVELPEPEKPAVPEGPEVDEPPPALFEPEPVREETGQGLPPEMGQPPAGPPSPPAREAGPFLPGMDGKSLFFINYLPEIYRNSFMESFLGIFESVLLPIEWNIDNFDLYLSPGTAPESFLPWLAGWYGLTFDATWSTAQRRAVLAEAHRLYAMRGTRWALSRLLEIYTGQAPVIDDTGKDLKPYTFRVKLSGSQHKANRKLIQGLIEANKPAHTTFVLEIEE